MAKKKKRGGKREGAGRPESEDKAKPVTIYFKESRLDEVPPEEIKDHSIGWVEKEFKKRKNKKK